MTSAELKEYNAILLRFGLSVLAIADLALAGLLGEVKDFRRKFHAEPQLRMAIHDGLLSVGLIRSPDVFNKSPDLFDACGRSVYFVPEIGPNGYSTGALVEGGLVYTGGFLPSCRGAAWDFGQTTYGSFAAGK